MWDNDLFQVHKMIVETVFGWHYYTALFADVRKTLARWSAPKDAYPANEKSPPTLLHKWTNEKMMHKCTENTEKKIMRKIGDNLVQKMYLLV